MSIEQNGLAYNKEELGLTDDLSGNYWRMLKYKIDYKAVYEASDKILAMKNQIDVILQSIDSDLNNIKEKLNN